MAKALGSGSTPVTIGSHKIALGWYNYGYEDGSYQTDVFFQISYYVSELFSGSRKFSYSAQINGQTFSGTETVTNPTKTGWIDFNVAAFYDVECELDGTKNIPYSFTATYGDYSATATATAVFQKCPTVPELFNFDGGTLGQSDSIRIVNGRTGLTYDLEYKTTYNSGTIASGLTTAGYVNWTPPLSLIDAYPNRYNISVTATLKSYYNGEIVGTHSATATYSLPQTYAPTVSISVSDVLGYLAKYGAYVQSHSRVGVAVTAAGKNGATIAAYSTTIDGNTYSGANVQSDPLKSSGTLTVKTTVTDSRGMTATASQNITVLAYELPQVSEISAMRSDASGNYLPSGAYYKITFTAKTTALNNRNSAKYTLGYKKKAESSYTQKAITAYTGNYSVSGGSIIISAASSAYDLYVLAEDDFGIGQRSTVGESGAKLFSILSKGLGFAFNKIAELPGVFDVGFKTKFTGGIMPNLLPTGANFDDLKTHNIYVGNAAIGGYINCPVNDGDISLDVLEIGNAGQIIQRVTSSSGIVSVWERQYVGGVWENWSKIRATLPGGCTAVEYIQSSGAEYIDTGFKPNQNTRIVMDFEYISGSTVFLFGARLATAYQSYSLLCTGSGFRSDYGAERTDFSGANLKARQTLDFNKNVHKIGTATVNHSTQTLAPGFNLFLFGCNTGGSPGYYVTARLYSCKIYDNGTLVRDFVPCKNSSGAFGLCDLVGKSFYGNAGSGSFIGA